jgi:non-ribosomal peptide synthetase component F
MLALRTDFSGAPTFRQLLGRIREMTLGAFAHQDLPFEKLVEELQPDRDLSHSPLFRIVFNFINTPSHELKLRGLALERMQVEREKVNFDLTLFMFDDPQRLRGVWAYNTDLFDEEVISRMSNHFLTLLHSIVADPDARLASLEILTESEKQEQALRESLWEQASVERLKKVKRKTFIPTEEAI